MQVVESIRIRSLGQGDEDKNTGIRSKGRNFIVEKISLQF
jgi:hypothetical protein